METHIGHDTGGGIPPDARNLVGDFPRTLAPLMNICGPRYLLSLILNDFDAIVKQ